MSDKNTDLFAALLSKRIAWLSTEIGSLDIPFSWEMPRAEFSDNAKVQAFLRGPEVTMQMSKGVRKFKSFHDANNCAAKWTREKQVNASFKMEASSADANAVVTVTKTRKWFAECQQKLQQYKEELARLKNHCSEEVSSSDKKRSRLECDHLAWLSNHSKQQNEVGSKLIGINLRFRFFPNK